MKNVFVRYANGNQYANCSANPQQNNRINSGKIIYLLLAAMMYCCFSPLMMTAQCTSGCGQSVTSNTVPPTNPFSNTFCITTASTLTYNQNFDMNGGTLCVGPNVTFNPGGGNYTNNFTINNYGSFSRGITLNSGQTFNNYGTFTGSVQLNGGTIVNYSGATFTPSSFNFNGGSFTNNAGAIATFPASITVNSGAAFTSYGTLTLPALTVNSSATVTLAGNSTINGNVANNGTINVGGLVTITGKFDQNSSGAVNSLTGTQCNALNVTGAIQGQGTYNGSNGLLLNKALSSPTCTSCLVNGASTTPPGAPANQVNGATLTASALNISGTITNPGGSPAATHYIVLRRFGTAVSDQPANYVNYSVGNTIGSSVVVAVNPISTLTFTDANAISGNGCGTYHYAVFPYNASGSCGTYNRTVNATNRSSITIASTGGTVSSSASVCPPSASGTLTLTGYVGAVVRWEYAVSPFSSWTTVSNTTNSYAYSSITQTTQFRAVVNAGSGCSNVNATAATITVADNTAPVISACPGSQSISLNSSCSATMPDYLTMVSVSDNCTPSGSITVTQLPAAGTPLSGTGTQTVTITATDASGNSNTCSFTLTKQDVTAPSITCPSNITVNTTAGTCGAVVNYTVSATDGCSGSTSCIPSVMTNYTLVTVSGGHTYYRSNFNTTWSAAKAAATALGGHLLTISNAAENNLFTGLGSHWAGFTDEAVEGTWVWVTGEPVTYTNWAGGEPNNSGGNEDHMQINWSGTTWNDNNGSSAYPFIVEFDCVSPTLNLLSGLASGSVFPVGTTTVSYSATDAAGNTSSTCSFTVTVTDATAPTITCPANITVSAPAGACSAVVNYNTPLATDNCATCSTAPVIAGYASLGIYNGRAYYISTGTAQVAQAYVNAAAIGAQMASITSAGLNSYLRSAADSAGYTGVYYIGLSDAADEGTFVWATGEPVSFTKWNSGEPNDYGGNEDYTQVLNTGFWNDMSATSSGNYIIEVSCIPTTRTAGLASGSAFPVGVTTVTYSATDPYGNTSSCSFNVTVNVNPSSTGRAVTAASTAVCSGSGTNIQVALSDAGVSYQLKDSATNSNIGSPVTGTGGTINLPTGNLTVNSTFRVYATGSGCSYQLTNVARVTVNPLPADKTPVTSASTVCSGTGTNIQINSSETGVNYQLKNSATNANVGTAVAGTGATINLPTGNLSATTTFYVVATLTATGCSTSMSSTVTVTVNPLPADKTPAAVAATVCTGTGTNIQIINSEAGVTYQLRNNTGNTLVGSAVAGTGGTINLPTGSLTANTTFNVLATNSSTSCSVQMGTTVTVNVSAYPVTKTIAASPASVCPGGSSVIQVALSQSGVNYQLRNDADNSSVGTAVAGNGGTINLPTGTISANTTYNVLATNAAGCSITLSGTVSVSATDITPPTIVCPANISVNAAAGACSAIVNYATPSVMDNCGGCSTSPAISGFTSLGIYNGNNYYISNSATTPSLAFAGAAAAGAKLASVMSAAENTFIRNAATAAGFTGNYLIGLNDTLVEGSFVWATGETVGYLNWAAGEPNNSGNEDIAQVYANGTWNDIGYSASNNYIIKVACITPVRTAGLASGSSFPVGTTVVTYTATDASGNTSTCSFNITVSVNPSSLGRAVTAAAATVCTGGSTNIQVALSDNGVSYQLRNGTTNIGSPVTGTGGTISLPTGSIAATTTFNVYATGSSCSYQLTNTATVTVSDPTVTGSTPATRCGSGSVTVSATASSGAVVDWYAAATGGSALVSGSNSYTTTISGTTTFYAQARNTTTGCVSAARTAVTATVTVPAISSFLPTSAGPGMSVVITGTNFTGATAVSFGGTAAASFVVNSATQITAVVAAGGSSGNVSVTTSCGTATLAGFTFVPAPTITSFTPASGYIGNTITITGTNFTGATTVTFGGTAAASYTVVSATTITAVLGSGATGSVSVTTPGGTATKTGFTYIQATIWTGTLNNSWNNAGNWNNGVPVATSLVIIPVVETYPSLGSSQTVGSLSLDTAAELTITGSNTLSVTGTLTNNGVTRGTGSIAMAGSTAQTITGTGSVKNMIINNTAGITISSGTNKMILTGTLTPTAGTLTTNGNLVLKSDASGSASIAQGAAGGNYINGTVSWERFIPGRRSWRLISYPFFATGAPTINASIQEGAGGNASSNPNPGYGTHITGGTTANGFDANPAGNPSMKQLSGSSWVGISSTNVPVTSQSAYFLFVRGSRANNLSLGVGAPYDNTTLRGVGNIKQGNQSLSISGAGWQLVGNPFPGPVNLDAMAATNSSLINRNFKFWDPKLGGSNNVGGYVTASYNGSGYDYAPAPVSSLSEFVQSGAAFFVDAKGAGTLSINEAHKSSGGSDFVFRPTAAHAKLRVDMKSINADGTMPVVDGVMIGIDGSYSNETDEFDAGKLTSTMNENLSVRKNGSLFSIERRSDFTNEDTIFLNLNYMKVKSYQLELNAAAFDDAEMVVYLEDVEANTLTPLDLTGTTTYNFSITPTFNPNRLRIVMKKNLVVLPVTITSITAAKQAGGVVVNWNVVNQQNIISYEIEKSADGNSFIKAGDKAVLNSNTASYSWMDMQPYQQMNFYRIKIIERNGNTSYSEVVYVAMNKKGNIIVYPNPVVNNTVQLLMAGQEKGNYRMNLYSAHGQQVSSNEFYFNGTGAAVSLRIHNNLPHGNYAAEIIDAAGKKTTVQIAVQ